MEAGRGSYALVLRVRSPRRVRVGRLGWVSFRCGVYLYLGSALGPGGVRARVRRHCGPAGRLRWHIDYLSQIAEPVAALVAFGSRRRECEWARRLAALPGVEIEAPGFGSSDCRCPGHLFSVEASWRAAAPSLRSALGAQGVLGRAALVAESD